MERKIELSYSYSGKVRAERKEVESGKEKKERTRRKERRDSLALETRTKNDLRDLKIIVTIDRHGTVKDFNGRGQQHTGTAPVPLGATLYVPSGRMGKRMGECTRCTSRNTGAICRAMANTPYAYEYQDVRARVRHSPSSIHFLSRIGLFSEPSSCLRTCGSAPSRQGDLT